MARYGQLNGGANKEGKCHLCTTNIQIGDQAWWDNQHGRRLCGPCGHKAVSGNDSNPVTAPKERAPQSANQNAQATPSINQQMLQYIEEIVDKKLEAKLKGVYGVLARIELTQNKILESIVMLDPSKFPSFREAVPLPARTATKSENLDNIFTSEEEIPF